MNPKTIRLLNRVRAVHKLFTVSSLSIDEKELEKALFNRVILKATITPQRKRIKEGESSLRVLCEEYLKRYEQEVNHASHTRR